MACRRWPAGDPPTGPRHRWKPRCRTSRAGTGVPWRWRPGSRGFPVAGDLGVGGRGFHGIRDLGVSSLSHTALWPPNGDSITDWIATLVTLLPALSASDAVWTCRDEMASLQAPGARCPLWVSPRLFLVIQARGESPDLYRPFQRPFRDVDEHKPPASQESCQFPILISDLFVYQRGSQHTPQSDQCCLYVLSVN